MDSILNTVYKKVRLSLNTDQKDKLKNEQLLWLKKRTTYLKESNKATKSTGIQGSDARMIIYDNDAKFIKDRILSIIKIGIIKKYMSINFHIIDSHIFRKHLTEPCTIKNLRIHRSKISSF